ncbi:outer membrane beta-barrel family protein [Cesiribacter sp. SM1]|uniref:outer membrane beta-barrel family protein n=1 Tax=Cesiribacter sp. SM1 TaxID=2861196 RepID=UPI001CD4A35F|nr:outer membrane beta-barrel family protein [Cesiribacter sp. SM1]
MRTFSLIRGSGAARTFNLKLLLAICLFPAFSLTVLAQSTLKGKVINEQSMPLAFATVTLLNASDSALVKGAISDGEGAYILPAVAAGKYLLAASMMGYQKGWLGPVEVTASETQLLPQLQLQETVEQLKAVTVVGQKPLIEQQADRMVVNVAGSILATGNTALEVLEKSPGVAVDQDGNISLNGRQGVIIMLDGKRTYLSSADVASMLRNMTSDALEQVEIITNPSAKYDAAGNSGIINIKTKKDKNRGTNGSLTLGTGYGRFEKVNGGLTLNHRQNSTNLFGSYNYGLSRSYQNLNIERNAFINQEVNLFDHRNFMLRNWQGHSYKAGVDFFLNKHNTLGLMVNGSIGDWGSNNTNEALHIIEGAGRERIITTLGDINSGYRNTTFNLNYQRTFERKGEELSFDADYSNYSSSKNSFFDNSFRYFDSRTDSIFMLRSEAPSRINIWVSKLDYTVPIGKSKLETGLKWSNVHSNNDARIERQESEGVWQKWDKFTNDFLYQENISAAYANWSGALGKINVMAGLRAEHTWYQGRSVKNDSTAKNQYLSLFPSLFLKRELNKKNQLGLSYSRRVDRPSYQDLNPFFSLLDVTTYSKGNPLLQPQFTHQLQLSHTFNKSVVTNLTYSVTDGPMTEVIETEGLDAFQTNRNLGKLTNWSLNISLPVTITKWWNMQNNLSAYHKKYTGTYLAQQLDVEQLSTNFFIMNSFRLPHNFSAELSGFYRSPMVWGTMQINSMYRVNAGLQYSFWDRNASLKLSANDIFRTQVFSGQSVVGENKIKIESRGETRRVNLSFNYRFGNKEIKPVGRKRGASSDEQQRIKGSGD